MPRRNRRSKHREYKDPFALYKCKRISSDGWTERLLKELKRERRKTTNM